ncbi:MAG: class I SAM-dependent methyltransferase [Candidatus Yanofskybacteria bacterium]|nr:class I SAM-dependent methyltransferase [Candidatus Yanofskybacteria bacterium]
MENKNYTDKKFWDNYFQERGIRPLEQTPFADIFTKYLTPDPAKHAFEIGCAGGIYLAYLAKTFGYHASGIDYSDEIKQTQTLFKFHNLPEPTLYKEDFFSFRPPHLYDVVCSFGFVEHFNNFQSIVRLHAALVANGGTLIITMPHFSGLQYAFHWLIDRDNLGKHNIGVMNPASLKTALTGLPFQIEYLDYYKTFGFWTEKKDFAPWEKMAFGIIRKLGKIAQVILGYDRPNRWISPHIVCVAKKI